MKIIVIGSIVVLACVNQASSRSSKENVLQDRCIRLEMHKAPNSHKFYEIALEGKVVSIRFGRIRGYGGAGWSRERRYEFDSWDLARKAFRTKLRQKLGRGYLKVPVSKEVVE